MTTAFTGQAGQQHDPDRLQKHWPNQMNAGLGETKDQALQQPKPKATMKYKHEQLIKDYLADTSQIVQFQRLDRDLDHWETWIQDWFPSFYEGYEWRLLPAPKPDVVIDFRIYLTDAKYLGVSEFPIKPNIRATWDGDGELKSVEKI